MKHRFTKQSRHVSLLASATLLVTSVANGSAPKPAAKGNCRQVVLEATVKAGQPYQQSFAKGLDLFLEPLASGWIVRVLANSSPRGPHDYAELATPPYQSVSPLLISTDYAFRAQDVISWNPRRFRYVATEADFKLLAALYSKVLANDAAAMGQAANLTGRQPEATLEILNSVIVPGTNDQWKMAAAVATHFLTTPHQVQPGEAPTKLGRITELQFRVRLDLPEGLEPAKDLKIQPILCFVKPTN